MTTTDNRTGTTDPYDARGPQAAEGRLGEAGFTETTEGRVYTVTGGDWDEILGGIGETERTDERRSYI